jgi:ribonuclease T1
MSLPGARFAAGKLLVFCVVAASAVTGCGPPPAGRNSEPEIRPERSGEDSRHHSRRSREIDEWSHEGRDRGTAGESRPRGGHDGAGSSEGIPDKVTEVLRHIDARHSAPEGYEGGRPFHNAGRDGEEALPRKDGDGRPISYREWDVNPKVPGVNRGAERLVTGSDGSAYYTNDHYRTFTKVR